MIIILYFLIIVRLTFQQVVCTAKELTEEINNDKEFHCEQYDINKPDQEKSEIYKWKGDCAFIGKGQVITNLINLHQKNSIKFYDQEKNLLNTNEQVQDVLQKEVTMCVIARSLYYANRTTQEEIDGNEKININKFSCPGYRIDEQMEKKSEKEMPIILTRYDLQNPKNEQDFQYCAINSEGFLASNKWHILLDGTSMRFDNHPQWDLDRQIIKRFQSSEN